MRRDGQQNSGGGQDSQTELDEELELDEDEDGDDDEDGGYEDDTDDGEDGEDDGDGEDEDAPSDNQDNRTAIRAQPRPKAVTGPAYSSEEFDAYVSEYALEMGIDADKSRYHLQRQMDFVRKAINHSVQSQATSSHYVNRAISRSPGLSKMADKFDAQLSQVEKPELRANPKMVKLAMFGAFVDDGGDDDSWQDTLKKAYEATFGKVSRETSARSREYDESPLKNKPKKAITGNPSPSGSGGAARASRGQREASRQRSSSYAASSLASRFGVEVDEEMQKEIRYGAKFGGGRR